MFGFKVCLEEPRAAKSQIQKFLCFQRILSCHWCCNTSQAGKAEFGWSNPWQEKTTPPKDLFFQELLLDLSRDCATWRESTWIPFWGKYPNCWTLQSLFSLKTWDIDGLGGSKGWFGKLKCSEGSGGAAPADSWGFYTPNQFRHHFFFPVRLS